MEARIDAEVLIEDDEEEDAGSRGTGRERVGGQSEGWGEGWGDRLKWG